MHVCLELFLTFARIGAFTFGGGYAMLPLLDHDVVEKKGWITEDELTEMTVIAESTPGPIAINCATYTGYKKAGIKGAVTATVGMILPSFFVILLLCRVGDNVFNYGYGARAFKGIRVAVGFLIMQAGITMTGKMMRKTPHKRISLGFAGAYFFCVLIFRTMGVKYSSVCLIVSSGILGLFVFGLPGRKGEK